MHSNSQHPPSDKTVTGSCDCLPAHRCYASITPQAALEKRATFPMIEATKRLDYYEFLQISVHADSDTIHRVYRYLAARFHPDNPDTGDPEKFFLLKTAYDVLSDPEKRFAYDR